MIVYLFAVGYIYVVFWMHWNALGIIGGAGVLVLSFKVQITDIATHTTVGYLIYIFLYLVQHSIKMCNYSEKYLTYKKLYTI